MDRPASKSELALSRVLRPFAKVEPSEAVTTVVLTVTVFSLLCGYYLLKTAREPLILLGGGAEVKSYAAAGQALLMLAMVRGYQSVAKRVGRLKLLTIVYLFFASNLVIFAALAAAKVAIGVPFYLWVGVFNYTSIAQFWAFAADVYSPEQGKRLFAILGTGSSIGAVAGAALARALVPYGPAALMVGATGFILLCIALIGWVDARLRTTLPKQGTAPDEPLSEESAFALLSRDRYLILLAALTLLLNWVNANGEYILDRALLASLAQTHDQRAAMALIGRFKADYFGWVNLVGLLLQLFVVSRVLVRFGPRVALFFLPVVALGGYGLLLGAPVLALIRVAKIAENSLDYSIQSTARQALYLVATRAEKYLGKTTVDTFFVRLGDVLSAVLVWIAMRLALPIAAFAAINLTLIALWLVVVVVLGREHRRREGPDLSASRKGAPVLQRALVAGVIGAALTATRADAAAPKRDLPDYDGRGGEPTTPGDVAVWVPRGALAPAYLVYDYGFRRPLGALIAGAERADLPAALYDFFFFGPDHKAGVAPIAFVDFGFNPSVGLYTFWDDAFFKGHDLRFHGTTWGADWLAGVVTERFHFDERDALTLNFSGIRRPDLVFYGIGPDTLQGNISRFGEDRLEANALAEFGLWRSSRVEAGAGVRSVNVYPGHFRSDPSLDQRAASGAFAVPYGYDRGYTAQTAHVAGALDTRLPRPEAGSGIRVEAEVEEGADARRSSGPVWLRYGGTAGAFLDLNGRNRVLSISASAQFADPVRQNAIPFTELVSLGGGSPMRGYRLGRLVDRSAAVATLGYRWPIWVWLDGSLQAAMGNVFGEHLDGFRASRFRLSGSIGVESTGSRDGSFELLVGVGTETFDQGTKVDSVRFAVGTSRGF